MKNEKGVFLISSFLVLSMIGTFSLALFLKNITLYRTSERAANRIASFHLAESGLDRAIVQLRSDRSYAGQGYTSLGNRGGFDVQVETPDVAQPNLRRITAAGYVPDNVASSYAYAMRQVVAYVDFTAQSSSFAIFSNSSIQMSGHGGTDSYDSRNGAYESSRARSNGHMGTNTTRAGMVMLSGHVRIKGNMLVGPGGNPSNVIVTSGFATIEGTRSALTARKVLDPVQVPAGHVCQGSLRVTGHDQITLGGGTHWFSSMDVSGHGKVNFTGPATVYVTGNLSLSGHAKVTSQNLPSKLTINVQGAPNVSISGHTDLYGVLNAPNAGAQLSSHAEIFGALVADTVQQSGHSKIHYDEALSTTSGGSSSPSRMLAWTEASSG